MVDQNASQISESLNDPSARQPPGETVDQRWGRVRAAIKRRVTPVQFRTWLARLEVAEWTEERLVLCDHAFRIDWLHRHYLGAITEAVLDATGEVPRIELVSLAGAPPATVRPQASAQVNAPDRVEQSERRSSRRRRVSPDRVVLNARYRFETFVCGPSNSLSMAAAKAVACAPGEAHNPLFFHGTVGLGKTHLMQAICHLAAERDPDLEITFVSCETFTNDFITAIERRELDAFRSRYRTPDILLIDDIQCLAGKQRTQEEFFHTFNALHQQGRQLVFASDRSPKEIEGLDDRLISRFEWGLQTRVDPPALETRAAIVMQKAAQRGATIDHEVARWIAERVTRNVRELEGAVNRVTTIAQLEGRTIDREFSAQALRLVVNSGRVLSFDQLLAETARAFEVEQAQLLSSSRIRQVSKARQVLIMLAERHLGWTTRRIGGALQRDHSSVLYARRALQQRLARDPALNQQIDRIERALGSGM